MQYNLSHRDKQNSIYRNNGAFLAVFAFSVPLEHHRCTDKTKAFGVVLPKALVQHICAALSKFGLEFRLAAYRITVAEAI